MEALESEALKKFEKKIDRQKGKDTAEMSFKEIQVLLDKFPDAIVYLYKLVNTQNWNASKQDCEMLCDYLLVKENPLIPVKFTNLTYAGICKKNKFGWIEKDYRRNSRDGYPGKMKKIKDRNYFDSYPLDTINEKHLAMRVFTQCRKTDVLKMIPGLGYILDYEMPIGGRNKQLYKIQSGEKYDSTDLNYRSGVHIHIKDSDKLYVTGNCDLVAFDDNQFIVLELKDTDSSEPIIRAILEAYTYKQLLNTSQAAKWLRKHYMEILGNDTEYSWRAAPLLYIKGDQHKEYADAKKNSALKKLTEELDVKPIWYDIDADANEIVIRTDEF
ncbi:hypothetical protein SAMN04487771_11062 [[Clostridium] aminophilum]|uniref:Uncharacterized protein n=1 Tax=[Clostridium] aminophilum TaxID=1526 RepID=A0A1I0ITK8_9FIRM|nr:hypothetical protein [[Clostridium] aminophilum]SEU00345.1 hypothetical protein SAMN04487771_11062 [[Clostridium] aminophilum]